MSLRSNGSYIGPRPAGPSSSVASGIWDLRTVERQQRAAAWPIQLATDPYFASVSLLLHMNGSNGSTTFTDSSQYARTGITSSGASISTAQSKFGVSSLAWDNNSISVPYNANLYDFGSGPFVIEFWMYPTSKPDNAFYATSGNWGAFALYCQVNPTDDRLLFLINNGGELAIVGLGSSGSWTQYSQMPAFTLNQWYYVAISRSGDTLRAYLNGQLVASRVNSSYSFPVTSANLTIGGGGSGYFDDFRITVGTDRGMTGSTITVPTAAFPDA